MIKPFLVACLIFSAFHAKSQSYGLQVGADYDTPVGDFAYTFKPTKAYHLDLLWYSYEKDNTINFTIGTNTFTPKEEIFYFLTNSDQGYGTTVYSDYKIFSAYMGWMRNLNLAERLKLGLGFNFGAYFSHYTTESNGGGSSSDIGDTNVYLAAKSGFSFDLSDHLQLNLQAKYNAFAPTGKNDARTPAFQDNRIGTFNRTWSSGLAIAYKF
ncbi:hypothetical protein [Desertivirga brevis]|uniref:hypothetical protein n=1 Tax=Desertivirga brevis TaxID=2810310 RepID=UPI001A973B4B|nr:hypothetical protein [Pedobacter sp. SYSU D00873]